MWFIVAYRGEMVYLPLYKLNSLWTQKRTTLNLLYSVIKLDIWMMDDKRQ